MKYDTSVSRVGEIAYEPTSCIGKKKQNIDNSASGAQVAVNFDDFAKRGIVPGYSDVSIYTQTT